MVSTSGNSGMASPSLRGAEHPISGGRCAACATHRFVPTVGGVTASQHSGEQLRAVERWFVAQGVPHFVADHSPTRVVLRRAAPILVAYLAVTLLMTASFQWSFELNLVAVLSAALIVIGGWAAVNILRGRRWRALPDRFGLVEIAGFLIIPALPPLVFGLQVSDAIAAVLESAVFLAVVYVATSYGIVGALVWAVRRAAAQIGSLGRLLTRALPLLMVFIAFTFLSNTVWQVATALTWQQLAIVLLFFLVLSLAFLIGRVVPELRRLVAADSPWPDTLVEIERTPAEALRAGLAGAAHPAVPLRWHEWVNVGTLIIFGQGIQIVLVTFAVQLALVVFGLLLVPVSVQADWVGRPITPLLTIDLGQQSLAITGEMLVVGLFLGAFSGLYFTVSALSDSAYRAEFFSAADREMRQLFAVRSVYHAARLSHEPGLVAADLSSVAGASSTPSRSQP
jgi:hypothetical protein